MRWRRFRPANYREISGRSSVRPAIVRPAESLRDRPHDRPRETNAREAYSEHQSEAAEGFVSRLTREFARPLCLGLVHAAVFHYESSPIRRPSTATHVQRPMDTIPTTLPQTGPTLASSAMVTLCRSVKVKINVNRRSRIFIQKNGL